jgi:hypothetical protein
MSRWCPRAEAAALAVVALGLAAPAGAAWSVGGDARYYQFLRADDPGEARRDAELGILRLKLGGQPGDTLSAEAHGVVTVTSPAATAASLIVTGTTRRFVELERTERADGDLAATLEVDRLNLAWEPRWFRAVAGRQAITWGVGYFWPVLDLFAPFSPARIDREYKPGVDAVRLTIPWRSYSQLDVVAAGQGKSLARDGSLGGMARFYLGPADAGLMAGHFHGDTVAGGFVTGDLRGTGLRGEAAFTESGESLDALLDRERFWRASAGVDRQLTPSLMLTTEAAWNGFGAARAPDYVLVALTDRVQRGEVTSLGRWYAGALLAWQAHPLVILNGAVLGNLGDPSMLLLPHADWSVSDDVSVVLGGLFGVGPGVRRDGLPASEYGAAPQVLYAAVRVYF